MASIFAGDLRDGYIRVRNIPVSAADVQVTLNAAGTISATLQLPLRDPYSGASIDAVNLITTGRSYLAYEHAGKILNAGPIVNDQYDFDSRAWTLNATGIRGWLDQRLIIPTGSVRTGYVSYSGLSLRTIAKRLVARAVGVTGTVPIVCDESDVTGSATRRYDGYQQHTYGTALTDLSDGGGPDIQFRPRYTADQQHIEWALQTGGPELTQQGPDHAWDLGVPVPTVTGIQLTRDATSMFSDAYRVGATPTADVDSTTITEADGSSVTPPLIGESHDTTLITYGYPQRDETTSSSDISDGATLTSLAAGDTTTGRNPTMTWTFQSNIFAAPKLEVFDVGDYGQIAVRDNPVVTTGIYRVRIAGYRVQAGAQTADIDCFTDRTGT